MARTAAKPPYRERTDAQKILANWAKTRGLLRKREYSMAIVRAAISVELAANLVIRNEYGRAGEKSTDEIDRLLVAANGMRGKFQRHILKIFKSTPQRAEVAGLNRLCVEINDHRNSVVHSGLFKKKEEAREVLEKAYSVISTMVPWYEVGFSLKRVPETFNSPSQRTGASARR